MRAKQAMFTALVNAHAADLYRYAFWLCRDRTLAEDLVQETFARAWRAFDSLRDHNAARQWLITTLRREHARLFARQQPEIIEVDLDGLESVQPGYDTRVEVLVLRKALAKLPNEYLEPLLLQVLWGYSCDEIAGLLGLSGGAVMTRLSRARRKLRNLLETGECQSVFVEKGVQLHHELP